MILNMFMTLIKYTFENGMFDLGEVYVLKNNIETQN